MNRNSSSARREQDCLRGCLDRLNGVPGLRAVLEGAEPTAGASRAEALVRLERQGATQRYAVQCLLRPTLLEARVWRNLSAEPGRPLLLCAPAMPGPLARVLREEGQEFVDAAGNMFLDASFGLIWIQGLRGGRPEPAASALLGTAGLKLASLLLRRPEAVSWNYRAQAEAAGISLGMVGRIVSTLRAQRYLRTAGASARRLARALDLLSFWESGYVQRLRPKLWQGAFRMAPGHDLSELEKIAQAEPGNFLVGGELGAARLLGGLRPETASMHIRVPWREAAVRLRLLPDPEGPVTLLDDFGSLPPDGPAGLAHPLFLRAELLLAPGRRLAEAAEALLRDHLEPELRGYAQG